jgi:hypothetical protein
VVQVTSLTVTVPETVDVQALEDENITAVADRLRDEPDMSCWQPSALVPREPETSTTYIRLHCG